MATRRRGTALRSVLALAVGAVLISGCDTVVGVERPTLTPVPDAVAQHGVTCPLPDNGSGVPTPALPEPGRVPDGFVPVAAVECPVMPSVTDAEGVWSAVEQVRYTGDLTVLLAALAEPDDRPRVNQACAAMLVIAPPLWLVDATGRAVLVRRPVDVCHEPQGGVDAALRQLTVESRKTTKVALLTPRTAPAELLSPAAG
ncbi:hypothetical protein ACFT5B_00250 [Luteimicrobium sp. NPDC057192]|uniref:hypothetical protein n=1 Tax=Luteimicrobium sp. NPDC057192 TaxID=3346042 RepID=UPI00362DEE8C